MHGSLSEYNNPIWFNQLQIAAAVLRVQRLPRLSVVRRLTLQGAPSQDWGEDDGEPMRLDSTSGALQRLPLHPHKCLLPQFPRHPPWLPPNPPAVREGGLAQTPCRSEWFRVRARQRATHPLLRNAGDVVAKSIRPGITSLRKTSWKTESTLRNPWDRTAESQEVRSFSPEISKVFN